MIIVGDRLFALKLAKEKSNNEPVNSLSRDNIISNAMKKEITGDLNEHKLIETLLSIDKPSSSNNYRSSVIIACIKATEFARQKDFKGAIKELERITKDKSDKDSVRKENLKQIYILLSEYEKFQDKSMLNFHTIIKSKIKTDISNLAKGATKTFYEDYSYQQLALCVKIDEDSSRHKTIHKSKGDEYNNVLVVLKEEKDLEFLISPDLNHKEEQRINYVAISRATDRLFINVPTLSDINSERLEGMFTIVKI